MWFCFVTNKLIDDLHPSLWWIDSSPIRTLPLYVCTSFVLILKCGLFATHPKSSCSIGSRLWFGQSSVCYGLRNYHAPAALTSRCRCCCSRRNPLPRIQPSPPLCRTYRPSEKRGWLRWTGAGAVTSWARQNRRKTVKAPNGTNPYVPQRNDGIPRNPVSAPQCPPRFDRPSGYFHHFTPYHYTLHTTC